jgi:hypothetical protein
MKLDEQKIVWFCLRTGVDRDTAIRFLKEAHNKIEVAIQLKRAADKREMT